jgi:hypothetical protein
LDIHGLPDFQTAGVPVFLPFFFISRLYLQPGFPAQGLQFNREDSRAIHSDRFLPTVNGKIYRQIEEVFEFLEKYYNEVL